MPTINGSCISRLIYCNRCSGPRDFLFHFRFFVLQPVLHDIVAGASQFAQFPRHATDNLKTEKNHYNILASSFLLILLCPRYYHWELPILALGAPQAPVAARR